MEEIIKSALEKTILPALANVFAEVNIDSYLKEIDPEDLKNINRESLISDSKKALEGSLGPGIKRLISKLILLYSGTFDFAMRLASIPLAIIGMGTTGPTISINLILPLLKQIQGEARNLSQVYDEVDSSLEALQIKEMAESNDIINGAYEAAIKPAMLAASIACSIVGVKCGDQEAQEPEVESPMPVDATVCKEYRTDPEHANTDEFPKDALWCLNFEHIMKKTIDDFQDDEDGTAADKYEAWRKENDRVLEDFTGSETQTAEEEYMDWLREHRVCKNCKNFKQD